MLSKEEKKANNQSFWDGFNKEMRQIKNRRNVNWLKYPTQIKHVYLRLDCSKLGAALNFDIQFKDPDIREIFWEQLLELRKVMEKETGTSGTWTRNIQAQEGFVFDRIQWIDPDLDYHDLESWSKIYAFLKERLLAFDAFYQEFKDVLILLVD